VAACIGSVGSALAMAQSGNLRILCFHSASLKMVASGWSIANRQANIEHFHDKKKNAVDIKKE
jgi:hypothetical protein